MEQRTVDTGHRTSVYFHVNRPAFTAPKIIGQIKDKATGAITYYKCLKEDGRPATFLKEAYGRMFGIQRTAIKPKFHKGNNPDKRRLGDQLGMPGRSGSRKAKRPA